MSKIEKIVKMWVSEEYTIFMVVSFSGKEHSWNSLVLDSKQMSQKSTLFEDSDSIEE